MSKLDERRKEYGIPDLPYLPQGKNVLVFRVPNETVSAGGIIIAETAQEPKPIGVMLAAGLAARDVMRDSLIKIGDLVWFGRFAGWEKEIQRDPQGKGKSILQMKIEDVLGSADALERVRDFRIEFDESNGEHYFEEKATKQEIRQKKRSA